MRGIATEVTAARVAAAVLAAVGSLALAGCTSTGDQSTTPAETLARAEPANAGDDVTDTPGDENRLPLDPLVYPGVLSVVAEPASTTLNVLTSACSDDPKVTVRETPTQVWLTAEGLGSIAAPGCAYFAKADLQAPLGGRVVMDTKRGDPVDVFPLSEYDAIASQAS